MERGAGNRSGRSGGAEHRRHQRQVLERRAAGADGRRADLLRAAVAVLGAGAISFAVGWAIERLGGHQRFLGAREGFLVVSLTWLAAAGVCAMTYLLTGEDQLGRPIDAYFESMSGFTTTGATVLTDVEAVPNSVLIWRQLSQWLGGMGIIVLAIAVTPSVARRRPAAARVRDAGSRDRAADDEDSRHSPTAVGALHRPDVRADRTARVLGLDAHRPEHEPLRGGRAFVDDDADRRVLDRGPRRRGVAPSRSGR